MKLTFLGTGTSFGVPVIGCPCKVCHSSDPHDNRLRASVLVETEQTRILVDCGPDFRQQALRHPFPTLDAVLLTHIHYDHVAGIDDLRVYTYGKNLHMYAQQNVVDALHQTLPYCFAKNLYPGVPTFQLEAIKNHQTLHIGDITVLPFIVYHGKLPIMAYRFGRLAYITDMKSIDDAEFPYLEGIDTLVINALRFDKPHHSHQLVDDAIAFARKIGARQTYFTHCTHEIGYHDEANAKLPKGFQFGYDGLQIDI